MKKICTGLILLSCLSSSLCAMDFPELHAAAQAGDTAKVRSLLDAGTNANTKNSNTWTPLHVAAALGHLDVAALLIERNANVQAKNNGKDTPLDYAAEYGHDELVELILHHGADPNSGHICWDTPLHRASENGHLGIARLLLDHGADIDGKLTWGSHVQTPLSHAADKGHYDVVKLLLDHNAKIDAADWGGNAPIHHAAKKGHRNIVQLLWDRGATMEQPDFDRTPLSLPVRSNQTNIVELLLVADPPKPKALPRRFPFFCSNTIPPEEEQLQTSQDRITALRCLCSFTKARCKSDLFSYLFKEQPLSPLPRLPLQLQDLIISHLPEDMYSPRLLARILTNLHTSHHERVEDLVAYHPRALFVSAFQKTPNEAMKRTVFAEIKKQVMRRASDVCEAEDGLQKRHQERYNDMHNRGRLQQLIEPDDPYEVRATFIHQQLEDEFAEGIE